MGQVVPLPNKDRRNDDSPVGDQLEEEFDDEFDDELDTDVLDSVFDDEADDELIRQWEQAERECVALLQEALPAVRAAAPPTDALRDAAAQIRRGVGGGDYPYVYIAAAAGWGKDLPDDDRELWVGATGALTALREDSGFDTQTEAGLVATELADWVGAVIGLVRAGVGASAEPAALVRYIDECPEVDGEVDPDDAVQLEFVFDTVMSAWAATGAIDDRGRLTPLGWWGLPRALGWAWNTDFDGEN
jgi:hypothetical protein